MIDTAHVYEGGDAERLLGQWFRDRPGVRERVVLVTKGAHPDGDRVRVTPADIASDLSDSIERLGGPVDLYLLHRDDPAVDVGELVDALDAHRRAGDIGAFGVSNWTLAADRRGERVRRRPRRRGHQLQQPAPVARGPGRAAVAGLPVRDRRRVARMAHPHRDAAARLVRAGRRLLRRRRRRRLARVRERRQPRAPRPRRAARPPHRAHGATRSRSRGCSRSRSRRSRSSGRTASGICARAWRRSTSSSASRSRAGLTSRSEPPFGIAPASRRPALSGCRRAGRGRRGGGDDAGDLSRCARWPRGLPGVVYLLAVLLVSTLLGARPRAADRGRRRGGVQLLPHPADGSLHDRRHGRTGWRSGVFLAAAVVASTVAELARAAGRRGRAPPRGGRPGGRDWRACCSAARASTRRCRRASPAARRGARPAFASIVLESPPSDDRERCRSRSTSARPGRPRCSCRRTSTRARRQRLRERVAPALEALLAAALDRDRLQAEVVETQALRRSDVHQDRAAAGGLARPAHAADRDHGRRRRGALADARAARARRARRRSSSRRRSGSRGSSTSCWTCRGCRRARPSRGATGARSRRSSTAAVEHVDGRDGAPSSCRSTATCRSSQADAAQLERVFVNLLENAQRFSGGHPVKVRAQRGRRAG